MLKGSRHNAEMCRYIALRVYCQDSTYLIVIGELFSSMDVMLGVDHNVLVPFHSDDLGVAVGVAAVVDEAG